MAEITAALVKQLRERTGAGMMECKKALVEAKGDIGEAEVVLRKRGIASAGKKAVARHQAGPDRQLHPPRRPARRAGGGQLRVGFRGAHRRFPGTGARPRHAHRGGRSAVHPQGGRHRRRRSTRRRTSQRARALAEGKPEKMVDKIVEGRMTKFYEEVCLLEQPFVKENTLTVDQLVKTKIAKLGENITVSRFVRFKVGDAAAAEAGSENPAASRRARYQRILLKLSGEVLAGGAAFGIDAERVKALAARGRRRGRGRASRSAWWSAAATSSAAWPPRRRTWTASRPTTWACWPR